MRGPRGLAALAVTALGSAWGATLYVDRSSATCSDTATYAQAQDAGTPFCTLLPAANVVNPGDLVLVASGMYPQGASLHLTRGGTLGLPVTFRSSGGPPAIIDGPSALGSPGVWMSGDYTVWDGFEIRNAGSDGIYASASHLTLQRNVIHDCARRCDAGTNYCGRGITATGGALLAEQNLVYRIGVGGNNDICFDVEQPGAVVRNNIAFECTHGFVLYNGCSGCDVYNNLAAQMTGHGFSISGSAGLDVNVRLFNNISWANATGVQFYFNGDAGTLVENNLLFANATPTSNFGGTLYTESGTVSADPLFVDAGQMNWHLRAGSAAIDHGSNVLAPPLDMDGCPRPVGGAVDIGPYEYGGCSDAGEPIAVVSPPAQKVRAGDAVRLDGTGSTPSPGGVIAGYSWLEVTGPTGVLLSDAGEQDFTLRVPGAYAFRLQVSDSTGLESAPATATVDVQAASCGCQSSLGDAVYALALLGLAVRRRSSLHS